MFVSQTPLSLPTKVGAVRHSTATCRLTRVSAAVWLELRPYRYIMTALMAYCRCHGYC